MKKVDCGSSRARFCRHRQFPPSQCAKGTFVTKRIGKHGKNRGVKGVFCRVGDSGTLSLQTKLYPKCHAKCGACRR
jgi:hypothetical protein